jgi:hypothetical protein
MPIHADTESGSSTLIQNGENIHKHGLQECRLFHLKHGVNDSGRCEASVGDILRPNWILFSAQRDSFVTKLLFPLNRTANYSTLLHLLPLKFHGVRGSWLNRGLLQNSE